MNTEDTLKLIERFRSAGAIRLTVYTGPDGEHRVDSSFDFGGLAPVATIDKPQLPEDSEERARELRRRADEIDFHSA